VYKYNNTIAEGTYYLRDASGKELAEFNTRFNTWTHYAYGRERIAEFGGSNVRYYVQDHLGSNRLMYSTNNSCDRGGTIYTIENANAYFAYGSQLVNFNNSNPTGYQGSLKMKEISENDYYTHFR
jgi:hypothetical protein